MAVGQPSFLFLFALLQLGGLRGIAQDSLEWLEVCLWRRCSAAGFSETEVVVSCSECGVLGCLPYLVAFSVLKARSWEREPLGTLQRYAEICRKTTEEKTGGGRQGAQSGGWLTQKTVL